MVNTFIYRNQLERGIYSRTARLLKVSVGHVCEVAKGNRRSQRVEDALAAEFARIDRLVERRARRGQKQGKAERAA